MNVTHSLQRAQSGEQPLWAALTLASLLGQIGLPGQGFAYSLGSTGYSGSKRMSVEAPSLPQGTNAVDAYIPVARVADMLLFPGQRLDYNGKSMTYPQIRLVYWAGGNPFHHHQDLFRLREAFFRPDTIVVHEPFWTATARNADIVLPATVSMERRDIGVGRNDNRLVALNKIVDPVGVARDDYRILADLSSLPGIEREFTLGRLEDDWLRILYSKFAKSMLMATNTVVPGFDDFWRLVSRER